MFPSYLLIGVDATDAPGHDLAEFKLHMLERKDSDNISFYSQDSFASGVSKEVGSR